jgi:hypothetical protein
VGVVGQACEGDPSENRANAVSCVVPPTTSQAAPETRTELTVGAVGDVVFVLSWGLAGAVGVSEPQPARHTRMATAGMKRRVP